MNKKEALSILVQDLEGYMESNVPIFLAAFYERSGKRNSDYTQWKKVLAAWYAEM